MYRIAIVVLTLALSSALATNALSRGGGGKGARGSGNNNNTAVEGGSANPIATDDGLANSPIARNSDGTVVQWKCNKRGCFPNPNPSQHGRH